MAKQGLMGMRPNKINFGLTFWAFLARAIREGQERRREEVEEEEEEEEKKRYGSLCICDFEYGKSMICMGYMEVFVWNLCMELYGTCMKSMY